MAPHRGMALGLTEVPKATATHPPAGDSHPLAPSRKGSSSGSGAGRSPIRFESVPPPPLSPVQARSQLPQRLENRRLGLNWGWSMSLREARALTALPAPQGPCETDIGRASPQHQLEVHPQVRFQVTAASSRGLMSVKDNPECPRGHSLVTWAWASYLTTWYLYWFSQPKRRVMSMTTST